MTSMEALDAAALAAARRLTAQQPQNKFIANTIGGIGKALAPIAPALAFIPGVGTAISAGIMGADALGNLVGGSSGGAAGGLGAIGSAASAQQAATANYNLAQKTMEGAVQQNDRTTSQYANALLALQQQLTNPALSGSVQPSFVSGGAYTPVNAPQLSMVGGSAVPGGSYVPGVNSVQTPSYTPAATSTKPGSGVYTGPSTGLPNPGLAYINNSVGQIPA